MKISTYYRYKGNSVSKRFFIIASINNFLESFGPKVDLKTSSRDLRSLNPMQEIRGMPQTFIV